MFVPQGNNTPKTRKCIPLFFNDAKKPCCHFREKNFTLYCQNHNFESLGLSADEENSPIQEDFSVGRDERDTFEYIVHTPCGTSRREISFFNRIDFEM